MLRTPAIGNSSSAMTSEGATPERARRMSETGMLTQGSQGGPLALRFIRIPTHFLLHLHGI
jgi:hypothetical protein